MKDIISADLLKRDDRVVLEADELPYLIDAVEDLPNGAGVRVTYSSGDVVEYAADDKVTISVLRPFDE